MQGPRPVVLSGPSGAGKSTLLKKLLKDYENIFGFSVSRESPGLGQLRASLYLYPRLWFLMLWLWPSLSVGSWACLNNSGHLLVLGLSGECEFCLEQHLSRFSDSPISEHREETRFFWVILDCGSHKIPPHFCFKSHLIFPWSFVRCF